MLPDVRTLYQQLIHHFKLIVGCVQNAAEGESIEGDCCFVIPFY